MPNHQWFEIGFSPYVPLQAIWPYVLFAEAQFEYERRSNPGALAGRYRTQQFSEAWEDYQASLDYSEIPEDAYYRLTPEAFQFVWNMCVAAAGSMTPEMRRHAFDVKARRAWTSKSRRSTFRHLYAFNSILVVQGQVDRMTDMAHLAHLVVEYDTIGHSINETIIKGAKSAQEWRTTESMLWVLCGTVTSIVTSN